MRSLSTSFSSLKLAQLKHLAVKCGVNSTGTKAVLRAWLLEELHQPNINSNIVSKQDDGNNNHNNHLSSRHHVHQRVLSIDMGIRNLAYCVLDIPSSTSPTSSSSREKDRQKIHVHSWKRMAITSPMSRFSRVKASQDQEEPNERNSVKEREDTFKTRRSDKAKDRDQTKEKESFEPFIYASHAYTFLSSVLAKYQPTHILIERQRYRSMGSSAILEWTVRVNMFEGMLYAVLRTLKERGDWNGGVRGVLPAKVAAFWLDPENLIDCGLGGDDGLVLKEILPGSNKKSEIEKNGEIKQAKLGKKKKDNKTAKINLVTHWLEYKRMVEFNTTLSQRTAEAFLARAQGRTKNPSDSAKKKKTNPKHRKSSMVEAQGSTEGEIDNEEGIEIEKITKLDDLADCLLQGIAWVKWEENKRVLLPLLVPSSGNEL